MEQLTLNDLKNYLQAYVPAVIDWENRSLHKTEEESRFEAYNEIVATQALEPLIAEYLDELKDILNRVETLDCPAIQRWCNMTRDLYHDRLFGFDLEYFYFTESVNDPIVYKRLSFTIPSIGFENLIQFCKVQNILYWGEYYMEASQRTVPDRKGYYYNPQDPNAPPKIDVVRALLAIN